MSITNGPRAALSPVRRFLVLPLLEVLTALRLTFLTRPTVQHPCWSVGRLLPSVGAPLYGPPVPANDHVRLVSVAGWEERADAVAARKPIPCVVQAKFADGYRVQAQATASAWSLQAVHVFFSHPDPAVQGPAYRVWVPLDCVRRLPVAR